MKFQKDRTKPVRGGGGGGGWGGGGGGGGRWVALIKLQYPSFHQRTNSF